MAKDVYKDDYDDESKSKPKEEKKGKAVKVKLLKGYVPEGFKPSFGINKVEAGEEIELPADEAKAAIDSGAAEAA